MSENQISLLQKILDEITCSDGSAATERFANLRAVDAKIREVRLILQNTPNINSSFITEMDSDPDFSANSRRVRLEALAHYSKTALELSGSGILNSQKRKLYKAPSFSQLTGANIDLENCLQSRWLEAQRCMYAKAYLSAVIMMGSILEGLLLAKAQSNAAIAYQAKAAPKDKTGKTIAIPDWNLNTLLDISIELGWIKSDRGAFGHALRQSRNIVHPWAEVSAKANFDAATARTSWSVLRAAVDDLIL